MAILVTGGAGYIGSHTCVELLQAGEDIVLLDNFSNAKPQVVNRIKELSGRDFPLYAVDILHREGLEKIFAREDIEAVIHFAGLKAVGESVKIPLDYYQNNVSGTINLCQVMARAGCKKIVFSSSATVYGNSTDVPFREDSPLSTTNPYGSTKRMVEDILRDLCASDPEWSACLLRYFNPIGAHKSGLLGEDPNGIPNNLLPYIAKVAVGQLERLNVFGNDYDTPDGTGVRDYLHVVDLAIGHLKALDYVRTHKGAEAINLGTGRGYSVLEVVKAFEKASGVTIPYRIAPRRPGDIATCYADPSKAKKLLGWEATRSLEEMCADAWNFTRRQQLGDSL
ncbi:MAG TPA: UDP-glucose 4-epimerase GalE [Clostridiales bacterium]|nr:UDP-glucose 4-epimerase GalE [Clostridiales bacterium]